MAVNICAETNAHSSCLMILPKVRKLDFSRASQTLPSEFKQLSHLAEVGTGLGVYDQHTLTLLDDTESIFISLLADIEHAKHTILLEFYIIEVQGSRVELVIDALIHAVNRGVACQLLLDSVGSHAFLRSKQRERMERGDSDLPVAFCQPVHHAYQTF